LLPTLLCFSLLLVPALPAPGEEQGLAAVKAESNPEKRSRRALDYADSEFKRAQEAYRKGDLQDTDEAIGNLNTAVQLAYDSLRATGKDPSRSPKHFKNAEIKTRELLRRLNDFKDEMSADDRPRVETARATLERTHEDLLEGIMGSKSSGLRKKR
jgi:hypothetical protein